MPVLLRDEFSSRGGCAHMTSFRDESRHTRVGRRVGGGAHRKLKDPAGKAYVVQAARSGFVAWSRGGAQGPMGWVVHRIGTGLVNRLVFRGGWTVVVWQGDDIAPKRTRLWKQRYRTQAAAVDAVEDLAATPSHDRVCRRLSPH